MEEPCKMAFKCHEVVDPRASCSQRAAQLSVDASAVNANGLAAANTVMNQPMGHQPMMAHDGSAPQHFMAAIPVQPVIAAGAFSPATATLSQADVRIRTADIRSKQLIFSQGKRYQLGFFFQLLQQPLVMTPAQSQLQEQLQRKHEELQQLIYQQQQELRLVSDQLLMARYGLLPASLLSVSLLHQHLFNLHKVYDSPSFSENGIMMYLT